MADDVTSPGTLHLREAEEKMRRALGLSDHGAPQPHRSPPDLHRPKRRFVVDGEVPVTVLPSSGRRHETEDGSRLETERQAREVAERALNEAQATIRDLQTQLKHAEMALSEVKASAAAERARADQAVVSLREAEAQWAKREAKPEKNRASTDHTAGALHEADMRRAEQEAKPQKKQEARPVRKRQAKPKPAARRKVVRKAAAAKRPNSQPVKWWLSPRNSKKKAAKKR